MNKDSKNIHLLDIEGLVDLRSFVFLMKEDTQTFLQEQENELNLLNQKKFLISLIVRNQNMFLMLLLLKLAASMPTIHILEILSMRNIQIQTNLIHSAWKFGSRSFVLGVGLHLSKVCRSSCKRRFSSYGLLNQQMMHMRLQRSLELNASELIINNMVEEATNAIKSLWSR